MIKKEVPGLGTKANCVAHVLHNCARYAADKLKMDVESVVTKIYNHFSSSSKRLHNLRLIFEFVSTEYSLEVRANMLVVSFPSREEVECLLAGCHQLLSHTGGG